MEPARPDAVAFRATQLHDALRKHVPQGADRLGQFVDQCLEQRLFQAFLEADDLALRLQKKHRWTALAAIGSGLLATVLGIAQLQAAFEKGKTWAWGIELALFLASASFVGLGLLRFRPERWLIQRFKAEHFRLLPYRLVIDPDLWTGKKPKGNDWAEFFVAPMDRISLLTMKDVETLKQQEDIPAVPAPKECEGCRDDSLRSLGRFYQQTILDDQKGYFGRKVEKAEAMLLNNPRVAPLAFIVAAAFAVLHLAFESPWAGSSVGVRTVSAVVLFLSLTTVVAWAAARTWKSANEFSRNAARAQAKRDVLMKYRTEIDDALRATRETNSPVNPWRLFKALSLCQAMLEAEQREWLRLMAEAEWY